MLCLLVVRMPPPLPRALRALVQVNKAVVSRLMWPLLTVMGLHLILYVACRSVIGWLLSRRCRRYLCKWESGSQCRALTGMGLA